MIAASEMPQDIYSIKQRIQGDRLMNGKLFSLNKHEMAIRVKQHSDMRRSSVYITLAACLFKALIETPF